MSSWTSLHADPNIRAHGAALQNHGQGIHERIYLREKSAHAARQAFAFDEAMDRPQQAVASGDAEKPKVNL